eukprot:1187794-Prorocentrum_minimum.AAC.1
MMRGSEGDAGREGDARRCAQDQVGGKRGKLYCRRDSCKLCRICLDLPAILAGQPSSGSTTGTAESGPALLRILRHLQACKWNVEYRLQIHADENQYAVTTMFCRITPIHQNPTGRRGSLGWDL